MTYIPERNAIRFIPTHVGNAVERFSGCPTGPVHPHACGERSREKDGFTVDHGSSPRMWGTLAVLVHKHPV